ncbi:hypothetical protein ACA910_021366 [Epithemia clementina (nom. ined.)]
MFLLLLSSCPLLWLYFLALPSMTPNNSKSTNWSSYPLQHPSSESSSLPSPPSSPPPALSKWARRTARKRQRMGELLKHIVMQAQQSPDKNNTTAAEPFPLAPSWDAVPVLNSLQPHRQMQHDNDENDAPHRSQLSPSQGEGVAGLLQNWILPFSSASSASNTIGAESTTTTTTTTTFEPQQLQQQRARRKQLAVEAFVHFCTRILLSSSSSASERIIVDACSGAGNLAIPLAQHCCGGIPDVPAVASHVLAIDVNDRALDQLQDRFHDVVQTTENDKTNNHLSSSRIVQTLCADLASPTLVLPKEVALVCSLHACGAATDLVIQLATRSQLPFVVSPCCTAKALTVRGCHGSTLPATITTTTTIMRSRSNPHELSSSLVGTVDKSSRHRSGAPPELIRYPRSQWLRRLLTTFVVQEESQSLVTLSSSEDCYAMIAKVADVGLGPQTPMEQRLYHQPMAKWIVECDRLAQVVEMNCNYQVQLLRIAGHEGYGKAEILVGVPTTK